MTYTRYDIIVNITTIHCQWSPIQPCGESDSNAFFTDDLALKPKRILFSRGNNCTGYLQMHKKHVPILKLNIQIQGGRKRRNGRGPLGQKLLRNSDVLETTYYD